MIETRRSCQLSKIRGGLLVIALIIFVNLNVACSYLGREETPALEEIYLPPSPSAAQVPLPLSLENSLIPTPTVSCENNLLFVADLTIPDGTEVEPGAILDKIWVVENNGSCNYNEHYRLKLIAGADLGAKAEQALYPARSGTQFQIRIRFVAPQEPGEVRSAWQAFDPQGNPFGDPVYLEVVVKGE